MVKLRLQRTGSKNNPHYRIVVADARSPRDGRFIELIGHYHPAMGGVNQVTVNEEKAVEWIQKGAQPTQTVKTLLKNQGILDKVSAKVG